MKASALASWRPAASALLFVRAARHDGWVKLSLSFRFAVLAVSALISSAGFAQDAPASPNVVRNIVMRPSPRAPEVHPDGSVTFTFVEPNVQEVKLSLDLLPQPVAMQPQPGGVWTYTTTPLKPGIYDYHYIADQYDFYDPASTRVISNQLYIGDALLIPGSTAGLPPQPWEHTDVPHGVVSHRYYHSGVIGDDRDYFVYTPPGYDPRGKKKYPVLYLLHGYSDSAEAWTAVGRANIILDNLLAAGKVEPMIVVMPLGYGDPTILHFKGDPFAEPRVIARNYELYTKALLREVMPQVEHDYLIQLGPKNTAIAGLSMGGAESLYTGLQYPDKFGYVVALSAAPVGFDSPANPLQWRAQRELLWLACGTQDRQVGQANRALDAYLKQQGINATFKWMDGQHTWLVWRENLVEFAPLLFRSK
jgi:enterochelin esterase family protein